jgi:hypothetical protein
MRRIIIVWGVDVAVTQKDPRVVLLLGPKVVDGK